MVVAGPARQSIENGTIAGKGRVHTDRHIERVVLPAITETHRAFGRTQRRPVIALGVIHRITAALTAACEQAFAGGA